MRKFAAISLSITALAFLALGCAGSISVEAKGSRQAETLPEHGTYIVLPAQEVEKDPRFRRYADLVGREMTKRGYRAANQRTARLAVFLAYAVRETARSSERSVHERRTAGRSGGEEASGAAAASSVRSRLNPFVTRAVVLVADLEQSRRVGELVELWRGESRTVGHAADLDDLLPFMIEAAFRHFGQTTSSTIRHSFRNDKER